MTVGLAHLGVWALDAVAVFDPLPHLLGRAVAGVGADVRLAADPPAPLDELVGSERVRVRHAPDRIGNRLAIRADAVLPVIPAGETAARPPDDGELQFLHRGDHVLAKAPVVRQGRTGIEHAAVDLIVKMFEKAAEDHGAQGDRGSARIDSDHRRGVFARIAGRLQRHVVVPGPAGRTAPTAEQAVDFHLGRIPGVEDGPGAGPVGGSRHGGGADLLQVLDVQQCPHRALDFLGLDPAGEPVDRYSAPRRRWPSRRRPGPSPRRWRRTARRSGRAFRPSIGRLPHRPRPDFSSPPRRHPAAARTTGWAAGWRPGWTPRRRPSAIRQHIDRHPARGRRRFSTFEQTCEILLVPFSWQTGQDWQA